MRIAWLSPSAGNSGIVEYTRQVLPALARHAEPELWSHGPAERPPEGVPCIDYAAELAALTRLDAYDMVVYNLGNHLGFHRAEYEASRCCPGVVILHDQTLHHFFAGYYVTYRRAPEIYLRRMTELYGERGRQVALGVVAQLGESAWAHEEEVLDHAFTEDALANALGAVVHSASHARRVRSRWRGPVCELGMPAYDTQLAAPVAPLTPRQDGLVTLMSIGHVERNKHVLTTVETLAGAPDVANRIRYLVIGQYDPRSAYIRDVNLTIADAGLSRRVTLLGYQAPRTLERYAATADVFVNLRFPNFESGSASLMEQLARGRATVVFRSGSYAELPDDVVAKVAPVDRGELTACLRELVSDGRRRARLGAAARIYAERHRMDSYAKAVLEFCQLANDWRPRLRLADRVGAELAWLGVDPNAVAVQRIDDELTDLLG